MDNLTITQRKKCMSNIRSRWTVQERKIHNYLKGHKIKHKMHPLIKGSPDIIIGKTAVFLNGCFWHKCPKCYKEPKSNRNYWIPKIERNVKRDRFNAGLLKKKGYKTIIMWEHQLKKDFGNTFKKMLDRIKNSPR